jgi:hypothetical protein
MGLILTVKHEYPSMQNTDGFSDLVQGHPGNRLEDSVVKIPSKSAQTLVALNIRRRGLQGVHASGFFTSSSPCLCSSVR